MDDVVLLFLSKNLFFLGGKNGGFVVDVLDFVGAVMIKDFVFSLFSINFQGWI